METFPYTHLHKHKNIEKQKEFLLISQAENSARDVGLYYDKIYT
jgi:hypothetical protein